ncbi:MAG: dipeptide ABC transporter ATP-binding protein [Nitrospinota bacterium]|nr:MAG: dipeptide ABC transporter ATP-binding protein [Nitrospinota bacterium]
MAVPLLEVRNLKKYFSRDTGLIDRLLTKDAAPVKAVDGISFTVDAGEIVGLVGESGCGKSTTGETLLLLHKPTAGEIFFRGENILKYSKKELRKLRRHMQMIFQDPYSSLNPRMKVRNIIAEPLKTHGLTSSAEIQERVESLLVRVGLDPTHQDRYPHEFSGGQRQRIGVARALAVEPSFVVADEPVSALDVSVQAQLINLLLDLQQEFHLSMLFISHDISVVKQISNRVLVMYLGNIVEQGPVREVLTNPLHPYTQALLSAVPRPNPHVKTERIILTGDVPSPIRPPAGCKFHPRCPYRKPECETIVPVEKEESQGHRVACHLY